MNASGKSCVQHHSLLCSSSLSATLFSQVRVTLVALSPFQQLFLFSAPSIVCLTCNLAFPVSYSWRENGYITNNYTIHRSKCVSTPFLTLVLDAISPENLPLMLFTQPHPSLLTPHPPLSIIPHTLVWFPRHRQAIVYRHLIVSFSLSSALNYEHLEDRD